MDPRVCTRQDSPFFTSTVDSRSFCETLSSAETRPDSPRPRSRPRACSQFKTERRHPHSPTPSPKRRPLIPNFPMDRSRLVGEVKNLSATARNPLPNRAQEIIQRMASLNTEMRRLEQELRRLPVADSEEMEESRARCVPALDCQVDFPETVETAETPKVKWLVFKRPNVNKAK